MSNKIYYRVGTANNPGVRVSIAEAVSTDPGGFRARFKEMVRADPHFLERALRVRGSSPDQYLREYDARARAMVEATSVSDVAPKDTCLRLYETAWVEPGQDSSAEQLKLKTQGGKVVTVHRENDTCPFDAQHESAKLPDDVTQIHGFGEGALLTVIRRRFLEFLEIHTYVGDILIVVNPYMFMTKVVHIETPAKAYQVGECGLVCVWVGGLGFVSRLADRWVGECGDGRVLLPPAARRPPTTSAAVLHA
jgi:hypothetical protein